MPKPIASLLLALALTGCAAAPQIAPVAKAPRYAAASESSPEAKKLEDLVKAKLLAEGNLRDRKVLSIKVNMRVGTSIVGHPGTYRDFEAVVQDTGEAGPYTYNLKGTVNGETGEVTIKRS